MRIYEEIIYQHLMNEFIKKIKKLNKEYLISGRNYRVIKIVLISAAKRYIFEPISIDRMIELLDKKLKGECST